MRAAAISLAAGLLALAAAAAIAAPAAAQTSPFSIRGEAAEAPPARAPSAETPPVETPPVEVPAAQAPTAEAPTAEAAAPQTPPAPAPTVRQRVPGEAAPVPLPPHARSGVAPPPADLEITTEPAPFDVDGDGRAPARAFSDETEDRPRPSTTTSPLGAGPRAETAILATAATPAARRNLTRVLRRDGDTVREIRIDLGGARDFVEPVVDRPIIPFRTLQLDGEYDSRAWTVFLSPAEAARGGTLTVSFTNSVLVLPEASRLTVFLNGREVAQTAIDSPDRTKMIALPVTSALLRPGENTIRLVADMRHRIDCSIAATFELWTRLDPRLTGFTFDGGAIPLGSLSDLPAVGVATNGATRLRVVQADPSSVRSADRMLRAVQAAAVKGRFVQPLVEVVEAPGALRSAPGLLNIVIGTYPVAARTVPGVPADGRSGPLLALVDDAVAGPTVVITGPTARDVETALARFEAAAAPTGVQAPFPPAPPWLAPGTPRVDGAAAVALGEAGVDTINFSGRRLATRVHVLLPPDFYAAAYGEAELVLDAAYAPAVKPGSRLSVFVNGALASVLTFTAQGGERLEDVPLTLLLQSFRPGLNTVEIAVELETEADRACLPGGTVPARDRFALLSSTRLVFPDFARIGRVPELASFAASGFPYAPSDRPVQVVVGGGALETAGAAGTLMARVAASRGAPLATRVVDEAAAFGDGGLVVVAPLEEVSRRALRETGAGRIVPAAWRTPPPAPAGESAEGLERYDDVLRRLREQLRQQQVRPAEGAAEPTLPETDPERTLEAPAPAAGSESWLAPGEGNAGAGAILASAWRTTREALDFGRSGAAGASALSDSATLLVAQAPAPGHDETSWMVVTAPTPALLAASTAAITAPEAWTRMGGRATAYEVEDDTVTTIAATEPRFVATFPLSFANMRLIAANWFSIHNGIYALALAALAAVLGAATWALVRPMGRGSGRERGRGR